MENKPAPIRMPSLAGISAFRAALREESGNALIELALSAALLVTLLLGSVELGMLAYSSIEISNAAHAGAQYGSQNHTSAKNSSGMQTAALQDAPNVSGMTATSSLSCVCANGTTSTCAVGDCSGSRILEYVQVNTTATVAPPIKVPGLPSTYTMTGKAVMRVVQ
jgi:Flp pilus assembly protein TadG